MKKITVLDAGLVGSLAARELAADGRFEVTAFDREAGALARLSALPRLLTRQVDLAHAGGVARPETASDIVVGALPGSLGHAVLRTAHEARKPGADIGFAPWDRLALDPLAKSAGVPAIVDCGVSPGYSNLAAGRAENLLDETDSIRTYVGGLPLTRVKPWEYRIVSSGANVVDQHAREARSRGNGRTVTKRALSVVKELDTPGVGSLEGFNTDGLRTLLVTTRARSISEKSPWSPGLAAWRVRLTERTAEAPWPA